MAKDDILKKIDKYFKDKKKEMKNKINFNLNYDVDFYDKKDLIKLYFNKKQILSSEFTFYGIIDRNNFWVWSSSIPNVSKNLDKSKKLKEFAYLFEKKNNRRMKFYYHLLTNDIMKISEKKHIDWINKLFMYLNDSFYIINFYFNNNLQFISLDKLIRLYV